MCPQIMIDTTTDTVESLRRFATLLQDEADSREEATNKLLEVPAGTSDVPAALIKAVKLIQTAAQSGAPLPPDEAPLDTDIDTVAIFGRRTPPVPLAVSGATVSVGSTIQPTAPTPPSLTPAPIVTVPGGTVVLDSSGIPHDTRIHQDTRKMNKNGTWQNKRGVDKTLLEAVTAELKAAWGKPAAAPAAEVTQVAPPPPPVIPVAAPVAPQPGPVVVGTPPVASVVPAAPGAVVGFRELMQKITTNTNAGKLSNDQVDAALGSVGLPPRQLIALVNQPTLIPGMSAYIDACLAA